MLPTTVPSPSPSATRAAPAPPSPYRAPGAFHCVGGAHWVLVTDEVQGARRVRSWIRIDPVIGATGPDDPAIPWIRVGADAVEGIGVCVPYAPRYPAATVPPDAAGSTLVVRRAVTTGGVRRWQTVPLVPWAGEMSADGGFVVAPSGPSGGAWVEGDYIVEVRPAGVGPSAWIGVRVVGPGVDG